MSEEKNFGYLNVSFQQKLIKIIIEDKRYATTILDIIDPHYFEGASFRFLVQNIKELYEKYDDVPSYDTISSKIKQEDRGDTSSKMHMDTLQGIKELELTDINYVKDTALNFCKQQVLKRELKVVQKIIDEGDFDSYRTIEKIIQDALRVGANTGDVRDVFENVRDAIQKDSRTPIPTGVDGLDEMLKGGLGMGELGVVLSPTGIGKSTILTKFANSAYNSGFKVLQIVFEDNVNSILRKHYTIWTGLSPDDLPTETENVVEMLKEIENESKGVLKICKLPSDSVTISELKGMLRKLSMEGFKPDLVIVDYVDCISPERATYGEEWKGEGAIMRHLEAMTNEFHVAIWAATQGSRASIDTEVVTTDLMGGSIKKAQIAHVVVSIGKTLEQKENNFATITLLKSRIGKDGVVWQNCHFNNEMLTITTDTKQETMLGHERSEEVKNKERAIEVFKARKLAELQAVTDKLTAVNLQPSSTIKPNILFDKPKEKPVTPTTIIHAKELSKQEKAVANAHKREEKEKIRAKEKELKKESKILEDSVIPT